ncbi:hypothetical protein [Nocardia sp. NPDC050435]|uniref:hypothetical protein n=1 Tax=Nocardia sp. NPDC050435 TaxID=3155040 RepID=UPI0033E55915
MTNPRRRALISLAALPTLVAVATGTAHAAPGQPGLAAPESGQPALTAPPKPPAPPSAADWIPEPAQLPQPSRPRPQQQKPPAQTVIQPRATQPDPDESATEALPAVAQEPTAPVRPDTFRFGNTRADVPDWIDPVLVRKAQSYTDWAEWWIADGYDRAGFSREESDRRAASTIVAAGAGAYTGTLVATPIPMLVGCGVGAVVGGVAGAAIAGIPSAGALAPGGAVVGGIVGCAAGGLIAGVPAAVAGAAAGGLLAGAAANALGGGTMTAPPSEELPALVDVPAVAPAAPALALPAVELPALPPPVVEMPSVAALAEAAAPVVAQVSAAVTQAAEYVAADPVVTQAVSTLHDAIAAMPPMPADLVGAVLAPAN